MKLTPEDIEAVALRVVALIDERREAERVAAARLRGGCIYCADGHPLLDPGVHHVTRDGVLYVSGCTEAF